MATGTVYPVAPGHPDMSGIEIPTIFSAKLQIKYYETSILPQISNTDYEGEIRQSGDKVEIRTVPDMVIRTYVKGGKLIYDTPKGTKISLLIDKGKYWAFAVNDVDRAQADINYVDNWSQDAAEQLRTAVDTGIFADIYDDADASNYGATAGARSGSYNLGTTGTPVALAKTNITDVIVDCGSVLDEQNVPETDRFIVLSTWAAGMILKSDLSEASFAGDETSIKRTGRMGMIDRFTLYKSNILDTTTDGADTVYNMIFGHPNALTFAAQVTEREMIDNPDDFGDLMRGLLVYGYKVATPKALGWLYAKKA